MVTGGDVPTSWNDLLNPKWKGKISIPDPKVGGGHYYFRLHDVQLFGKEWFEKVRANDPLLHAESRRNAHQIMSGERVMGVNISVLARRDGPYPAARAHRSRSISPKEGGALLAGSMAITRAAEPGGRKGVHRMGDQPRGQI